MPGRAQATTFDAHAAGYDDVASSVVGIEYRNRVRAVVAPLVDPRSQVLDVGCGTGLDAAWLGDIVAGVHAVDPSPEMVAVARRRTETLINVRVEHGDLVSAGSEGPFDLVLANFGAINCVPSLEAAGRSIEHCLAPGGHAVLVTMPPVSPLERLVAVMTRNRQLWARRTDGPTTVAGYVGLDITYATAAQLAAQMPSLDLVRADALGVVLPSFEHRDLIEERPKIAGALARADRAVAGLAGRIGWGDHIIAVFRKSAS